MSFCREHAFYQPCPGCAGEVPVWVIPIVEAGREVGEIRIPDTGDVQIVGEQYLPIPSSQERVRVRPSVVPSEPEAPRVELAPVEIAPGKPLPGLLAFFLGVDMETARERGRKVYERALAIADVEGIPLIEALELASGTASESEG